MVVRDTNVISELRSGKPRQPANERVMAQADLAEALEASLFALREQRGPSLFFQGRAGVFGRLSGH